MNSTAPLAQQSSCLQIKGSLLPLTVLELLYFNPTQLSSDLLAKVTQAPDFFKDLPVVIGLSKFDESKGAINFNELMSICNTLSIKPVALRGGSEIQQLAAKSAGLAYMPAQKERSEPSALQDLTSDTSQASISSSTSSISTETENTQTQQKEDQPTLAEASPEISEADANISETDTKATEAQPQTSRIIYQPVRSGQQIYAQNGDLIILGPVGAGAEVLADGNIHVYGPLRGRALAGVRGNTEARIFCYSLEAELVSIAGQYKISEDLQTDNWKKPTQINLVDEKLTLKPLVG